MAAQGRLGRVRAHDIARTAAGDHRSRPSDGRGRFGARLPARDSTATTAIGFGLTVAVVDGC